MSKTPVSALQEYMVKNVLGIPVYDLVAEKTGTQFPSFTYRVKCGEHYSLGTASTKKQAKHNAARELIKCLTAVNDSGSLLKKSITTNNTTQINSYYKPQSNAIAENEVFVNSVGKLNVSEKLVILIVLFTLYFNLFNSFMIKSIYRLHSHRLISLIPKRV